MEHKNLEELLSDLRASRGPELPGSFTRDVLREIRLRQAAAAGFRHRWSDFVASLLRPVAIAASLGIAAAVGTALPLLASPSDSALAARNSDLNIFSGSAPNIPSGLLARVR